MMLYMQFSFGLFFTTVFVVDARLLVWFIIVNGRGAFLSGLIWAWAGWLLRQSA